MFCVLFLGLDPVTRIFLQWWQMQNLFQYVSQLSTDAQVGIAVAILVPIIGAVWKWWKRPSPFAIAIEGMKPTNTGWRLMMVTIRNGLQVPVNVVEIRSKGCFSLGLMILGHLSRHLRQRVTTRYGGSRRRIAFTIGFSS